MGLGQAGGSRSLAGTMAPILAEPRGGGGTPHAESCKQLVQACNALSSCDATAGGKPSRRPVSQRKGRERTPPNRTICPTAVPHLYPNSTLSPEISFRRRRRKFISLSRHTAEIFLCLSPQLHSALYHCIDVAQREAFCVNHNRPNTSALGDNPCPEQFTA